MMIKTALVLGYGVSGQSATMFLKEIGAEVYVYDQQLKRKTGFISDMEELKKLYRKKIDLVVTSPGISTNPPIIRMAQARSIEVIGEIELGGRFCKKPIVAITGTNGKSTTATLLGLMKKNIVVGNIGIGFCSNLKKINSSSSIESVIVEVSAGQLKSTSKFRPNIAIITNIRPEHRNLYSWSEYLSLKKKVYKNQKEGDILILNYDDPIVRSLAQEARSTILYFSLSKLPKNLDGIFIDDGRIYHRYSNIIEEPIMEVKEVKVGILENVMPVLLASLHLKHLSEDRENIRKVIRNFNGLEHTTEFVQEIDGVQYINDSKATNPWSTLHALQCLKSNVILITGGQKDKQNTIDFIDLSKSFPKYCKHVFVIGEMNDEIRRSAKKFFRNIDTKDRLIDAVEAAKDIAKPGDYILFSPGANSRDMFANHRQRGNVFKKLVRRLKGKIND